MTAETPYTLRQLAREVIERREAADVKASQIRAAQHRAGHAIDTRADYAEGSRDAYTVVCSIIAGIAGVATIEHVAADLPRDVAPPVLPDGASELHAGGGVMRMQTPTTQPPTPEDIADAPYLAGLIGKLFEGTGRVEPMCNECTHPLVRHYAGPGCEMCGCRDFVLADAVAARDELRFTATTNEPSLADVLRSCRHALYADGHCAENECPAYVGACPLHAPSGRTDAECALVSL